MADSSDNAIHSVVNLDDPIGKSVGRRLPRPFTRAPAIGRAIYRRRKFTVCEKGVFRFTSHQEADAWMMDMAIKRAHRSDPNPPHARRTTTT